MRSFFSSVIRLPPGPPRAGPVSAGVSERSGAVARPAAHPGQVGRAQQRGLVRPVRRGDDDASVAVRIGLGEP